MKTSYEKWQLTAGTDDRVLTELLAVLSPRKRQVLGWIVNMRDASTVSVWRQDYIDGGMEARDKAVALYDRRCIEAMMFDRNGVRDLLDHLNVRGGDNGQLTHEEIALAISVPEYVELYQRTTPDTWLGGPVIGCKLIKEWYGVPFNDGKGAFG
jgi:hypothetical protein